MFAFIIEIAVRLWEAARISFAAFIIGFQLFYVIGPLLAGAALACFMLYIGARFVVFPAARIVGTVVYRLGLYVYRTISDPPEAVRERVIDAEFASS